MARSFNGSSDYVSLGTSTGLVPASHVTVAAFVKSSSLSGDHAILQRWGAGADSNWIYLLETTGTNVLFAIREVTSSYGIATGTTALSTGSWIHLAGTYDGSNVKAWINGTADATAPLTGGLNTSSNIATEIGRESDATKYFSGTIAEACVFNAALSSAQLKGLAAGANPFLVAPGTVIGYWPLWGNSPEPDYSGNRRSGTVTGTTIVDHAPVSAGLLPGRRYGQSDGAVSPGTYLPGYRFGFA